MSALAFVRRPLWALAILAGVIASLWIAHRSSSRWDYQQDAGPPIDALIHGRFHEFLAAHPVMGPLSLVFRAPFAALGQALGHGGPANLYNDDYRFGVFPCLLAALAFGVWLGRVLELRGRHPLACAAVALVCVVNPVSLRAIHFGHPEEVLGAALLAGSMLAALRRRPWLAAILLTFALVNKQWALIGAPAVVVTLGITVGWANLRTQALVMLGLVVVVVAALLAADAHGVLTQTKNLGDLRGTYVFPGSIWYGIAPDLPPARALISQVGLHAIPDWLGLIARPLIVVVGVALPLAFAARVRQDAEQRAFPLLALVMLLRCMLDPADNSWYHLPFLLAVVAADGFGARFYATAFAVVALAAPTAFSMAPETIALFYACWAPAFAIYLAGRAYGLDWVEWFRTRGVRGRTVAP